MYKMKANKEFWISIRTLYLKIPNTIREHLPLIVYDVARGKMPQNTEKILDVCCGTGEESNLLRKNNRTRLTVIDTWLPVVKEARRTGYFSKVIYGEALKELKKINSKSFDVVSIIWGLEHFTKKNGLEVIREMERIAKKKVMIAVPNGYLPRPKESNPHQKHKSGHWEVSLESFGYKLNGIEGWKEFRDENYALKGRKNQITYFLVLLLTAFSQLVTYHWWKQAWLILAVKELEK
jgi:SAM-dependent methyltransferase